LPKATSESGAVVINTGSDSGKGDRKSVRRPGDSSVTRRAGVSTAGDAGTPGSGSDARAAAVKKLSQAKYWASLAAITVGLLAALLAISFLVN
jgi:hypothetical protein